MKNIIISLVLLFVSFSNSQSVIISGQKKVTSDSIRWGLSAPSTEIMARLAAIYRNEGGVYTRIDNTIDSCSQPLAIDNNGVYGVWSKEFRYSVRATAIDSAILKFNVHTRYCSDARTSTGCEDWVVAGKTIGDGNVKIKDTLFTLSPTATTIERQSNSVQTFGNQIRVCPVISLIGGQTGDSTFFSGIIFRQQ